MANAVFTHLTATPEAIDPAGQELSRQAELIQSEAQALRRVMEQLDQDWKGRGAMAWIPALLNRLKLVEELASVLSQMGAGLKSAAQVYQASDSAWGQKFEALFTSAQFSRVPDYPGGR